MPNAKFHWFESIESINFLRFVWFKTNESINLLWFIWFKTNESINLLWFIWFKTNESTLKVWFIWFESIRVSPWNEACHVTRGMCKKKSFSEFHSCLPSHSPTECRHPTNWMSPLSQFHSCLRVIHLLNVATVSLKPWKLALLIAVFFSVRPKKGLSSLKKNFFSTVGADLGCETPIFLVWRPPGTPIYLVWRTDLKTLIYLV